MHAIWKSLKELYCSASKVQIFNLRGELQNLNKGTKSIIDYLSDITNLVHALVNAGDVASDADLIMYTLNCLGDDYESFIKNIGS